MCCLADSLARTSLLRVNKLAFNGVIEAVSGSSSLVSSAKFDPVSCCWRMSQTYVMWGEQPLLQTLPAWGMSASGFLYELPMWMHRINANAGFAWVTPVASDTVDRAINPGKTIVTSNGTIRQKNADGSSSFIRLSGQVQYWGTTTRSTVNASGRAGSKSHQHDIANRNLRGQVVDGNKTKINPDWEEPLMGFPVGWTDITSPPDLTNPNTIGKPPELSQKVKSPIDNSA